MSKEMGKTRAAASRRPDYVAEVQSGKTIVTFNGFLSRKPASTAEELMRRVLDTEEVQKLAS